MDDLTYKEEIFHNSKYSDLEDIYNSLCEYEYENYYYILDKSKFNKFYDFIVPYINIDKTIKNDIEYEDDLDDLVEEY